MIMQKLALNIIKSCTYSFIFFIKKSHTENSDLAILVSILNFTSYNHLLQMGA